MATNPFMREAQQQATIEALYKYISGTQYKARPNLPPHLQAQSRWGYVPKYSTRGIDYTVDVGPGYEYFGMNPEIMGALEGVLTPTSSTADFDPAGWQEAAIEAQIREQEPKSRGA